MGFYGIGLFLIVLCMGTYLFRRVVLICILCTFEAAIL